MYVWLRYGHVHCFPTLVNVVWLTFRGGANNGHVFIILLFFLALPLPQKERFIKRTGFMEVEEGSI